MNEGEILEEASKFSEASIEMLREITPELPFGNEEDIKSHSGMISRIGLKWAVLGLRYFPQGLFEILEKNLGKEQSAKLEYEYGKTCGTDIHERFRVLGLSDLEALIATMSVSCYCGWGIPYFPDTEGVVSMLTSAVDSVGKEKRLDMSVREFADKIKPETEKYGGRVEMIFEEEARSVFNLYWINSFVAESYMYKKDRYEEPVCHFLSGVTHGVLDLFASAVVRETEEKYGIKFPFDVSMEYVKETSCKAQGKRFCTMEWSIKTAKR